MQSTHTMMDNGDAESKAPGPVVRENVTTFRMMPDAVRLRLAAYRLSGGDWAIVMALMKYSHNGHRSAFPGNQRLAKETGLAERSVQKRLASLEEKGLVRRTTATDQEAGATHRLIELCFLNGRASQGTGPLTQDSGASTTPSRAGGGTPSRAPEGNEVQANDLVAASGPEDGAVARKRPSKPPTPARRSPRARRPAQPKPPTPAELKDAERLLGDAREAVRQALWGSPQEGGGDLKENRTYSGVTAEQLVSTTFPRTSEAIEQLAELCGRLLGDPGGVATYRKLIARGEALSMASMGVLEPDPSDVVPKSLLFTMRRWSWGKVSKPGAYFTRRAMAELDKLEAEWKADWERYEDTPAKGTSKPATPTTPATRANGTTPKPTAPSKPATPYLDALEDAKCRLLDWSALMAQGFPQPEIRPADDKERAVIVGALAALLDVPADPKRSRAQRDQLEALWNRLMPTVARANGNGTTPKPTPPPPHVAAQPTPKPTAPASPPPPPAPLTVEAARIAVYEWAARKAMGVHRPEPEPATEADRATIIAAIGELLSGELPYLESVWYAGPGWHGQIRELLKAVKRRLATAARSNGNGTTPPPPPPTRTEYGSREKAKATIQRWAEHHAETDGSCPQEDAPCPRNAEEHATISGAIAELLEEVQAELDDIPDQESDAFRHWLTIQDIIETHQLALEATAFPWAASVAGAS